MFYELNSCETLDVYKVFWGVADSDVPGIVMILSSPTS